MRREDPGFLHFLFSHVGTLDTERLVTLDSDTHTDPAASGSDRKQEVTWEGGGRGRGGHGDGHAHAATAAVLSAAAATAAGVAASATATAGGESGGSKHVRAQTHSDCDHHSLSQAQ